MAKEVSEKKETALVPEKESGIFDYFKTQISNSEFVSLLIIVFLLGIFSNFFFRAILWFSKKKKCSSIDIRNKNSSTIISLHSLSEIIRNFFKEREDIIIKSIILQKQKGAYLMTLEVKLADICNINETTTEIEEVILKKLNRQLGNECIRKVLVRIKDIFRAHRLAEKKETITKVEDKSSRKEKEKENEVKSTTVADEDDDYGWT